MLHENQLHPSSTFLLDFIGEVFTVINTHLREVIFKVDCGLVF
jgi:hypothetical protein